jgi:hypothetical protein
MKHSDFETKLPDVLRETLKTALEHPDVKPDADHTKYIKACEKRAGVEVKKTEKV